MGVQIIDVENFSMDDFLQAGNNQENKKHIKWNNYYIVFFCLFLR